MTAALTIGFVPGVSPGKWGRVWEQSFPDTPLHLEPVELAAAPRMVRDLSFDAILARLPAQRPAQWHAVAIYTEVTVVVVPREHELAILDEVTVADLASQIVLLPADTGLIWEDGAPGKRSQVEPESVAEAVTWCAASAGVLVVPMSLARLHRRKDLTYMAVVDAPTSTVGLMWLAQHAHPLIDDLAGIVRGRKARSSRGTQASQVDSQHDGSAKSSGRAAPARKKASGTSARPRRNSSSARRPSSKKRPKK